MNTHIKREPESKGFSETISDIKTDLGRLLHEEIRLAKIEMAEKASLLKTNLILAAAGGFAAGAASVFLLAGAAIFIAFGIRSAGLNPWLSAGVGASAVFLVTGVVGLLLLRKGAAGLGESLIPEKTLQTLGKDTKVTPVLKPKDEISSKEAQSKVESIQASLDSNVETLKNGLKPKRLFGTLVVDQVKRRPFQLISLAATVGITAYKIAIHFRGRKTHPIGQRPLLHAGGTASTVVGIHKLLQGFQPRKA